MTGTENVTVRRVVLAYDGSPSAHSALVHAVELAEQRGTDLLVLTAIDVDPGMPEAWVHLSPAENTAVEDAVARARRALGEERVASAVVPGEPADVVLRTVHPGDLVVIGSHSHGGLARILLGSTSRAVATQAHVPVVVVRPGASTDGRYVLVGVDGSEVSRSAVRFAADEAERLGLPLRAVLVLTPADSWTGIPPGPDDPTVQQAEAELHESLAGLREDHPDLEIEAVVNQGTPEEALLSHARTARLLVVGSRGRGPVRSALLGSVGRHVVERAPCPVAVTH